MTEPSGDRLYRFLAGAAIATGLLSLFFFLHDGTIETRAFGQAFTTFVLTSVASAARVAREFLPRGRRRERSAATGRGRPGHVRWNPVHELVIEPGARLRR